VRLEERGRRKSRALKPAATLAGDLGFDDAWIAKCLDHAASKKSEQAVPTVTGKVYNHSKRMKEKRAVLDGVAADLRRIIGKPTKTGRGLPPDQGVAILKKTHRIGATTRSSSVV
jgi:hypothetical protein